MRNKKEHFPFAGELFRAKKKLYKELFFFVHFYEGNKRLLRRHIALVNKLGYDAFAFNLHGAAPDYLFLKKLPLSSDNKFGVMHVYADQIEACLNLFNETKIIYGFSNPCMSIIEALARRHCVDVRGMICDSGPSGKNFVQSAFRLMRQKDYSTPAAWVLALGMCVAWDINLGKRMYDQLASFPAHFPILSIRGWKDELITPSEIDQVFEPHSQLDWCKLSLPEAGHLNGLRDYATEFVPPFCKFLDRISTKFVEK